uniref:Protein kinase domain-containing protein n=1 Tax=Eutreptiella gymnastica TaxID=73025 RepID=A0A7S4GHR1_9EUGL
MDMERFFRLVSSGQGDGTGSRSQNADRVFTAANLGPSVPWVFDNATGFSQFVPPEEGRPEAVREKDFGNDAYNAGRYEEAVRHYTNAIHLDKDNATYYTNRSAAFLALDKLEQALYDANKAIKLKPDWSRGHSRKGAVLYRQGKYMLAAAAYAEAVALDPEDNKLKMGQAKSELAYKREVMVEHLTDSKCTQTNEVNEGELGAVIKSNISWSDGFALLDRVHQLRRDNFFYDPSADLVADSLKKDVEATTEFNRLVRQNKNTIQYPRFCKLQQAFYDHQDTLRERALGGNKQAYDAALKERNESEQELINMATASLNAYHDLAELEKKRSEYIRTVCDETEGHMKLLQKYCDEELPPVIVPNLIESTVIEGEGREPTTPTGVITTREPAALGRDSSVSSVTEINDADDRDRSAIVLNGHSSEDLSAPHPKRRKASEAPGSPKTPRERTFATTRIKLDQYQEWKQKLLHEVGDAVSATNAAANHLHHCLLQEEMLLLRNLPLLNEAPTILRQLCGLASNTVRDLKQEDVSVSLQHIRSQQADFESAYTNLLNIKESRTQADRLLQEETELEKERLALEKRRIKVQAEADWLKVQGEDGDSLDKAVKLIAEYKERISRVVSRQSEVEQLLSDLAQSHQPELLWNAVAGENSTKNRHLKWVKGSGAWMNRSLTDFDIKRILGTSRNSKVFQATHYGHDCVLKEIPMDGEDARKALMNEVKIITQMNHPNIMHINGVFADGPMAYVVMPYYPNGTVCDYVKNNAVSPWILQEIFRQMCSGVANLHEHGVIHRDLKPSNILMQGAQPLIADFGIAKDTARELDTTTASGVIKGTTSYLSPEVLQGSKHTSASDIWALGVVMYEIAAAVEQKSDESGNSEPGPMPVLMPGQDEIQVPTGALGNPRLEDLVTSILQKDPQQRPTAHAVLAHPYFAVSLLQDMTENRTLIDSDQKLAAFASFLQQLRSAERSGALLKVQLDRNDILGSIEMMVDSLGNEAILHPVFASFRNESAVDEGGVRTEMYSLYFMKCVARDTRLFVCSEVDEEESSSSSSAGSKGADDVVLGAFYLPNPLKDDPQDLKAYNVFGRMLLKSLVDNCPCPFQPSLVLFKYLAGVPVGLADLEQYDKVFAHHLRDLLITKEDVSTMGLDFSDLMDGGEDIPVTNDNKREYVEKKIQYTLVGQRKDQLEAILHGFYCNAKVTPQLKLLSPVELMILMCGSQHIKPELLSKQLAFRGWPVASKTPQMLIDLIHNMSQNHLRRFLRLTTAACVLPYNGLRRKISVVCLPSSEALPVGHTCSIQLDLPDYNNSDKLKQKMDLALAHVDDPFGYA